MGGGRGLLDIAEERAGVDLWALARERYEIVESLTELEAVRTDQEVALLGLFAEGEMAPAAERSPSLAAMMSVALEMLEGRPGGFFLMVESEGTDTEAHRNAGREILVREMLAFDDAVRLALELPPPEPPDAGRRDRGPRDRRHRPPPRPSAAPTACSTPPRATRRRSFRSSPWVLVRSASAD